jgi:hypothetical protein
MTKLEILRSYSTTRIRDSWAALGSQAITESTKAFTKDMLYVVDIPASALHGYLLYIKEEIFGAVSWQLARLEDYNYGEISFQDGIISPNFIVMLTADELAAVTDPVDESFIPYSVESSPGGGVDISEDELNIILTDLGVPFIRMDELEYSRPQILDLMIKPALEEYFKWFPRVEIVSYPLSTANRVEKEFPTGAYDVVHVTVTQGFGGGAQNVLLRYFDEVVWNSQSPMMGSSGGGRRAPRSTGQDWGSMMLDRAVRQGLINYGTRIQHHVVNKNGKKFLTAYCNKLGTLQVHYAMRSYKWEDSEFARRPELRELARAHVLRAFGAIRAQAKADIPGAVDYSEWERKSFDLREKVITEWKSIAKYSGILRGSS